MKSLKFLDVIKLSEEDFVSFNGELIDISEFVEKLKRYNQDQKKDMRFEYYYNEENELVLHVEE